MWIKTHSDKYNTDVNSATIIRSQGGFDVLSDTECKKQICLEIKAEGETFFKEEYFSFH